MESSAETFSSLLSKFRAPRSSTKIEDVSISVDTIIGTRIRPLLPDELKEGLVSGVIPRADDDNVVDLHELKIGVRRDFKLNVRTPVTPAQVLLIIIHLFLVVRICTRSSLWSRGQYRGRL